MATEQTPKSPAPAPAHDPIRIPQPDRDVRNNPPKPNPRIDWKI